MILGKFEKQPGEIESYTYDPSDDLDPGDKVQTVTASVDKPGLAIMAATMVYGQAKVWLSGGKDGVDYKVTVVVDTSSGRRLEDEFIIKVRER